MIVEEIYKDKFLDLLWACVEQPQLIKRIILEVDPNFEKSKLDALLKSSDWTYAVYPLMISDNPITRAKAIIDKFINRREDNLTGTRFLDFGCGDNYVIGQSKAKFSIGYDINPRNGATDNFNEVRNNAPYDVILIYDVLDHLEFDDPPAILKSLGDLLSDDGKVFLRCHPWTSKSATHVYRTINKAWIHYFYSENELREMGCNPIPTLKIINPITTYNYWISQAELVKLNEFIVRDDIPDFFQFKHEMLIKMIKEHWKTSVDDNLASGKDYPLYQQEQNWVDYVLSKEPWHLEYD